MQLADIGINLTHDSYDSDRAAVIARAVAQGVTRLVVTAGSASGTAAAVALVREYSRASAGAPAAVLLRATAGVHPHHASEFDDDAAAAIATLAESPEIAAIGECGLDYFRDYSPRDAQRAAFARQLELAVRLRKPVFLHQRDAHDDFVAILRDYMPSLSGGVAHCFTGQAPELEAYLALGLAIGITGWINDERRGRHLLPLMRLIPAGRLMIETDGPYLLPRDLHPKPATRRNEPAFLPHIAATVAHARGETIEALASHTTAAAVGFFWKDSPAPRRCGA